MEEYLVNEFLESLRLEGRHRSTVAEYGWNLRDYAEYLGKGGGASFFAATRETAGDFLKAVKEENITAGTVNKKHHSVYRFYEWLKERGRILLNPFPKPKFSPDVSLPRRLPCAAVLDHAYKKLRESPHLVERRGLCHDRSRVLLRAAPLRAARLERRGCVPG